MRFLKFLALGKKKARKIFQVSLKAFANLWKIYYVFIKDVF